MIGSRAASSKVFGCLVGLRVVVCLGAVLVEEVVTSEFSRFTRGLRDAGFLTVLATGGSMVAAFVVAARDRVVLVEAGATVVGIFVRVEARVAAVAFAAILWKFRECQALSA